MLVETLFQYRTLIGKSELGCGLDWDEIEAVTMIERGFALDRGGHNKRRFKREAVELAGVVRGDHINDRVDIVEVAPGGLVCRNAPFVTRGEEIEILIELGGRCFRFRARGVWSKPDGDNYQVGLVFVGMPICLRQVRLSAPAINMVDQISAA